MIPPEHLIGKILFLRKFVDKGCGRWFQIPVTAKNDMLSRSLLNNFWTSKECGVGVLILWPNPQSHPTPIYVHALMWV